VTAARRRPAHTWWGRAWVEALEQRAQLDPNRLPRGRTYARQGAVGELTFASGEVRAPVRGRRSWPYDTRIRVRRFTDEEWDRVLGAISAQLGHAAALLDGELPPEVAADVQAFGLDLLPGSGELGPRCSCPDDADPCKHSAAVCYLIADALDADPFVLLLLRGRSREEVLSGLRSRRRSRDAGPDPADAATSQRSQDPGVDARAALSPSHSGAASPLPDLPLPPLPPQRPGHPAALPADPPPRYLGLREDLASLAADAVHRAWRLVLGLDLDTGLDADSHADLARRAEASLGTPGFARLAEASGVGGQELARLALGWRYGGPAGLEVLGVGWDPDWVEPALAETLESARVALRAVAATTARRTRNRLTAGRVQLRFGRDRRWYPYLRSEYGWEPAGPAAFDPAEALHQL